MNKVSCLIILFSLLTMSCGVRKNTAINVNTIDSTSVSSSATEEHFSHFRVDSTRTDTGERIVTKTTYFAPIVLEDGTVIANCIESIEQETIRTMSQINGITETSDSLVVTATTDSISVKADKTTTDTIYVDTKKEVKISAIWSFTALMVLIFALFIILRRC